MLDVINRDLGMKEHQDYRAQCIQDKNDELFEQLMADGNVMLGEDELTVEEVYSDMWWKDTSKHDLYNAYMRTGQLEKAQNLWHTEFQECAYEVLTDYTSQLDY